MSIFPKRETPQEITSEEIAEQTAVFLKNGGKVYYADPGETGLDMDCVSVKLGIKSRGNIKVRDSITPKKGWQIPDDL
jgi:hypothetical protein